VQNGRQGADGQIGRSHLPERSARVPSARAKPALKGVGPVLHPLLESDVVGDECSSSDQNTTGNGYERRRRAGEGEHRGDYGIVHRSCPHQREGGEICGFANFEGPYVLLDAKGLGTPEGRES